jgi:hypothetical protein
MATCDTENWLTGQGDDKRGRRWQGKKHNLDWNKHVQRNKILWEIIFTEVKKWLWNWIPGFQERETWFPGYWQNLTEGNPCSLCSCCFYPSHTYLYSMLRFVQILSSKDFVQVFIYSSSTNKHIDAAVDQNKLERNQVDIVHVCGHACSN